LAAQAVAPPADDGAGAPVAERRITSVLFGDIVGFTPLSESRDAEDVRELLSKYFDTARSLIERFGGVVEKFIGDAVMAVWGVPTAHEDDAERAVRAALDLVDAVSLLGDEIGVPGLAMRVGIVTGEVAVTLGAAGQGMVAGDAVNTAARVQAVAGPGEVWVDETTRAATAAAVAYDDVGTHEPTERPHGRCRKAHDHRMYSPLGAPIFYWPASRPGRAHSVTKRSAEVTPVRFAFAISRPNSADKIATLGCNR
jgi:class 3 adenylate cyclase